MKMARLKSAENSETVTADKLGDVITVERSLEIRLCCIHEAEERRVFNSSRSNTLHRRIDGDESHADCQKKGCTILPSRRIYYVRSND